MQNGFSSKNPTSIVGWLTSIAPTKLHAEGSEAKDASNLLDISPQKRQRSAKISQNAPI
jgi:hypothetical protein